MMYNISMARFVYEYEQNYVRHRKGVINWSDNGGGNITIYYDIDTLTYVVKTTISELPVSVAMLLSMKNLVEQVIKERPLQNMSMRLQDATDNLR